MLDKEERGQRLRSFAEARGLSAYMIARRMTTPERTVYAATIYDWWRGRHRPSPKNLRRYAEVVEASVEELLGDEPLTLTPAQIEEQATEIALNMLQEMLAQVAAGEAPGAVHGRVTGEGMPPELANALDQHAPQLRTVLNQMAGGDFLSQPPDEQLRIVRRLFRADSPSFGGQPSL